MSVRGGLLDRPFAHRGLWAAGRIAENTLAGFEAARDAGYGVELDVRLSGDGEAVVFHDANLARLAGIDGQVSGFTTRELAALRLTDGGRIATLAQALEAIGPGVAVLIELKTLPGAEGPLEHRVAEVAEAFGDLYAYIGFNPHAVGLMATLDPSASRGMSALDFTCQPHLAPPKLRQAWTDLEQADIAQPDFLVLDKAILDREPTRRLRAGGLPVVAWTVRTEAERAAALGHCDQVIFEGLRP